MKKTLVALAVAAFATSASALTVYENEGTKVEMYGKVAVALDKNHQKVDKETTKRAHTNLHNDGTRLGVKARHDIAEDFYGLARMEFRFDGNSKTTSGFGDLYAYRAYVGLGSKQYGELTFGAQETIGNNIAQAGFDNAYGVFKTTLATNGKSVIRYDYKGVEGLQVGLGYRFAENRGTEDSIKAADDAVSKAEVALKLAQLTQDAELIAKAQKDLDSAEAKADALADGEVVTGSLKSGYDVGAKYTFAPAEGQSVTVAAGYSRDNYKVEGRKKHHKDAYAFGAKYTVDALTVAADYAGSFVKNDSTKTRFNGLRVGAQYQVTPAVAVYGNYGYGVTKKKAATTAKTTHHKYMLGTSYQLHKNVFTYLEGGLTRSKTGASKTTDKGIAVGLSVSW